MVIVCIFFQSSTDMEEKCGGKLIWKVTSSSGLSRASHRLHTEQPISLVVDIPGVVSTFALKQFFQVIQKEFIGLLFFNLQKSYLEYDKCDKSLVVFPNFK